MLITSWNLVDTRLSPLSPKTTTECADGRAIPGLYATAEAFTTLAHGILMAFSAVSIDV
jgi:hypothetical protein